MSSKSPSPIRLGVVGANVSRGWARDAHLPALRRARDSFPIVAVSARDQLLADEAADHFGATRGYGDSLALARDPHVDLVVVTVRVPEHRTVVLAALAAGKHVYCEWPLGRDVAESKEMVAAIGPGQRSFIGAQALSSPALLQAAELIRTGAIGRPMVLRAYNTAAAWGPVIFGRSYLEERENGATMATIGMGHMLAAIDGLVGPYCEIDARASILVPHPHIADSDETAERTSPDHYLILGKHDSGCLSTLEAIGGTSPRPASIEVHGETGWVRISGTVPGSIQIPRLKLEASIPLTLPPEPVAPELDGFSANLAEVYARLDSDLNQGTQLLPDFADALRLARVLDAIDTAASGMRQVRAGDLWGPA